MRILLINPFYYPNEVGGTERVVRILAEGLHRQGHVVAVYTVDGKAVGITTEIIDGVIVYRGKGGKFKSEAIKSVGNKNIVRIQNSIIQICNTSIKSEFQTVISLFKPDICHTHNLYGLSTYIWSVIDENSIPIVHTSHDYWLLNKLNIHFTKKYSKAVKVYTAPSEYVVSTFKNKHLFSSAFVKCIPNGINANDMEIEKNRINAINRTYEDKPIRFVFAGQLEEIKGIRELVEAFASIDNPDIELIVCGSGNQSDYVHRYATIDPRIKEKGKLSYRDLIKVYLDGDVMIAPSKWEEPFGMVALEAFVYGLPIVGGRRGGLQEIIETLNSGVLLDDINTGSIKSAICSLSDKVTIRQMIENRRNDNFKRYSCDKQISNYTDCYKKILES